MCTRNVHRILILLLPLLAAATGVRAQKGLADTIVPIAGVDVSAARLDIFSVGSKIVAFDSTALLTCKSLTLSDLLSTQSLVAVKSYGAGSLATISMRGTGASHVAVTWNGFSLQSPMNGGTDVSLLPVFFADKVTLQVGGAGALFGSGALGGSIHFENRPVFDRGWDISAGSTAASFGDYSGQLSARISGNRAASSTRIIYNRSANNYPYVNTTLAGLPTEKLSNAGVLRYGILQENYFKAGKNQELNLRIWCQNEEREIPPLMIKPRSSATQDDGFARISAGWQRTSAKTDITVRSGYFYDRQQYVNPEIKTDALLIAARSATDAEITIRPFAGHIFNSGISVTYAQATSDNYAKIAILQTESVFVSWKTVNKKGIFRTSVSIREEMVDGKLQNPVPAAGLEWDIFKGFTLHANASGVYRLPTLNDRYWVPGGNPDLKSEQGWSEEFGIRYGIKRHHFSASADVCVFNSNVNNWIIWLPRDSYWSPRNLLDVWSRGAEAGLHAGFANGLWQIKVNLSANYTRSTNQSSKYENDASVGKQLIYVPDFSAFGNAEIKWRRIQLMYLHAFTGKRFTTSDNSFALEPYQSGKINLSWTLKLATFSLEVFGGVNNLWNSEYQAIAWMPAPGRSYSAGLMLGAHGKFKNKPSK